MDENATGTLTSPYPGAPITSGFGPRPAPLPGASTNHRGVDFGVGIGTPTRAMDGGTVIFAGRAGTAGNVVVIDHGNGAYTRYLHLDSFDVRIGDTVEQGDVVARSGNTGLGTGPHGHVELRIGGTGTFRGGPGSTARAVDFEDLLGGGDYTRFIVLREGDQGSGVARLQEQLVEAGYDLGTTGTQGNGVDGDYGDRTVEAVMAFQRDQGFTGNDVDGKFGPQTRAALAAAIERGDATPTPADPAPDPVPTPEPADGAALDTPGTFAATSSSEILSTRRGEGEVPLSGLDLEQTRLVARAVFGDNAAVDVLSAIGAQNGDERVFLQRVVALARHEGAFSFGRENADPARGFNVGTFQEGGSGVTSQAASNAQFEGRVQDGVAIAERALGRTLTAAELENPAVRDVLAFAGWRQDRSEGILPDLQDFAQRNPGSYTARRMEPFAGTDFTGDSNQLFRILADPTLTREQVVEGVSYLTQGGIRDIGENVYAWTTPGGPELYANLDVARARAQEPDDVRSEPAFPVIRRGDAGPAVGDLQAALVQLGYDLGTTGGEGNGVDGDFGGRTLAAVQDFQRQAGFADTSGVVGPQTWGAIAARVSQAVTVETDPAPTPDPVGTTPENPLGSSAPEEYAVRQFGETVRDATWAEDAARVPMSDDVARWVADTETPGDARVQLTFPGRYDRVSQGLTARPGSDVAAVLDAARQAENGIQVRVAEQNGVVGTYVLIDEAAILSRFESVDAFVAAARADLAIQDAVETDVTIQGDAQTPAEARAVLGRPDNAAATGFLQGTLRTLESDLGQTLPPEQAAGFTDTLYALASNTGRGADGTPDVQITEGLVRDEAGRAGVELTDAQVGNAVTAMSMVRSVAEVPDNADVVEAVSTLRTEAAEARAPGAAQDAPVRDVPATERQPGEPTDSPVERVPGHGGDGATVDVEPKTNAPVLV